MPVPCPECHELTMEVVQVGLNDEYEAECSGLWHAALRHTKVEHMISNGDIEYAAEGVS